MLKGMEAVIFDLDGTLVDSMWVWQGIDSEYLAKRNLSVPEDLGKQVEGMSFPEVAMHFKKAFNLEDSIEEIIKEWFKMAWNKYENEVTVKPGVIDFLKYLKAKKKKIGIATSNSRELAEMVLNTNDLTKYIDVIVTASEVTKGKPEPDIYLKVAEELGQDPSTCLVFEDVLNGMMAGKRAGMKVCAVYDASSMSTMEEKKEVADYVIDYMTEIELV